MGKEISKKIKVILKNRGISLEEAGKRLGMSKQGVSWVLSNREDEKWEGKEELWWKERLGLKEEVFKKGGKE
jgi:transcriptional regulator with XRE-family HTH domain